MIALFALSLIAVEDMPPAEAQFGRVVSVVGKVTAVLGNTTRTLARGDKLYKGDVLKSEERSQAQLLFSDRSVVSMGPSAELVLSSIEPLDETRPKVSVKLVVGRVWARVQKWFGGGTAFTVETANAVAGVRGTSIFVGVDGSKLEIAVERGTGVVFGKDGKETELPPMTQIVVNGEVFGEVGVLDLAALTDLLNGFQQSGGFSIDNSNGRLTITQAVLSGGNDGTPPVNDPAGTVPSDNINSPVNIDPQQSNREAVIHGTIQIVP